MAEDEASGEGAGAAVSDIVPEATFIEDVAAYVQGARLRRPPRRRRDSALFTARA